MWWRVKLQKKGCTVTAIRKEDASLAYIEDFHQTVKAQSFSTLPGLSVLEL